MKAVSVWNPKGGQGKSTISINIAGSAVSLGLKVLIIDRDPQGTSMKFFEGGNLPFDVVGEIPDNAPDVDLVILDHMANDYSIPQPNTVVMPFIPKRSQYSAYIDNKLKAESANKNIISVVTNGDSRLAIQRDTMIEVRKKGAYQLKRSVVFDMADSEYRTVFDPKYNSVYRIERTRSEVNAILTSIMNSK